MDIRNQWNQLLAKKMHRRDFVVHVAIGAAGLFGGGVLFRLVQRKQLNTRSSEVSGVSAYGGGNQGGDKTRKAA
ncbi:hypothetical protein [Mycobacterium sp. C31M]